VRCELLRRLSRDSLAAQILLGGRASQGKPEGCHLRRTGVEKIPMTLTTRPKALTRKSRSAYPVSADFVRVQAPHDCFHVGVTQPLRSGAKVNSGPKAFRGERRSEFVELGKLFAACDAEERLWCEFSTGGCRPKLDFLDLSQGRSRTGEARRAWLLALRHNGRAAVDRVQFRFLALASGPGVRRILAHGQPDALRPLAPFQVVGPIGVALGRSVRQQPHRGACGRWPRGRPGSGAFSCWFGLAW